MKGKLKRLISFLLMLALLVSSFAVFASAEEVTDTEEEEETVQDFNLLTYRNFDEGWEINNGINVSSGATTYQNFYIDHETTADYSVNNFARLGFLQRSSSSHDGYLQLSHSNTSEYTILSFDLKIDKAFSYGGALGYMQIKAGVGRSDFLTCNGTEMKAFGQSFFEASDEWVTLTYIFDYTDPENVDYLVSTGTLYRVAAVTAIATDADGKQIGKVTYDGVFPVSVIRLGIHSNYSGDPCSICIDNFCYYTSASGRVVPIEEIAAAGYGSTVDATKIPTVDVGGSGGDDGDEIVNPLDSSLAFKVGVNYCLQNNETRAPILVDEATGTVYGAPTEINGKIMIPVEPILDHLGYAYYPHPGGGAYDISSGQSATSIYAGRESAIANGESVFLSVAPTFLSVEGTDIEYLAVCIDDIEILFPGVYLTYDAMGLIVIALVDNVLSREAELSVMLGMMKKFVFDIPAASEIREDVAALTLEKNGAAFAHPYIYADQTTFDELFEMYQKDAGDAEYDATLTKYIQYYVNSANSYLKKWGTVIDKRVNPDEFAEALEQYNENGIGIYIAYPGDSSRDQIYLPTLSKIPGNVYDPDHVGRYTINDQEEPVLITLANAAKATNNGYDPTGGRLLYLSNMIDNLVSVAYAYQVTHDLNYARFAYDMMKAVGEWDHWGPGHFLNCADTTQFYSIAYDWLYNAFVELNALESGRYNPAVLANALYEKGVYAGYSCGVLGVLPTGTVQTTASTKHGFQFLTMTNNWNCVSNCGMTLACLALLGDATEDQAKIIDTLLVASLDGLTQYGLDCYAPDGSYAESPSYWSYGTTQLFKLVSALVSATGSDYGIMDTWGLDKTCYYALHIASADGRFNYHDDGGGNNLDSAQFTFVGWYTNDPTLVYLRYNQVETGQKSASLWDTFYYFKTRDMVDTEVEIPHSYFMEGIQTYVIREAWERGALFTGLHGGKNSVNHGNIDSGTFIYINDGTTWFGELGSENYNVGGYFASGTRYNYYRTNTEGQNTLCLTGDQVDCKYGQLSWGESKVVQHDTNEHGGYSILDMESCFVGLSDTDNIDAMRGLLVTNDYQTTVIQDNINFDEILSIYWFAHFDAANQVKSVEIDSTGRVAYLTDYSDQVLRVTLISRVSRYKFTLMSANDVVLNTTIRPGENSKEIKRNDWQKLAIHGDKVLSFNVAVVLERVNNKMDTTACAYTLADFDAGMKEWNPKPAASDNSTNVGGGDNELVISPTMPTLSATATTLQSMVIEMDAMGNERFDFYLSDFYRSLITVDYSKVLYPFSSLTGANQAYIPKYEVYVEEYQKVMEEMNYEIGNGYQISRSLLGF